MNITDVTKFSNILDDQAKAFIDEIDQESKIDSKKLHANDADFPIFRPANRDYYEYTYYEGVLEWRIREYLIDDVFCQWFKSMEGYDCYVPDEKENVIHFQYSNQLYGNAYPFALIVNNGNERIGIRYSSLHYESKKNLLKLLKKHKIKKIEIIDWDDTDAKNSKKNNRVEDDISGYLQYVTLHQFIESHFSTELYPVYRDKVRETVEQANNIIGFQTIPQLSLRHLSDLKESVLTKLYSFRIEDERYLKFNKKGQLTEEVMDPLSSDAYDIIRKRCIEDNLCSSLIGTEKFAKCFITSEYLFNVFKSSEQHYFDYSTVVSGYFKSVELLLEKIMLTTLKRDGHDKLWISGYKPRVDDTNCRRNPNKGAKGTQVKFIDDNKKFFKTEMGPLIWFIHDNDSGWYLPNDIDDHSRAIVHDCLFNYNQGCRNEHLHKDVIDGLETIRVVRNNTILCLFYLLGSCKFCDDPNMDYEELGAINNSYDRLYKKLKSMPRSVNKYFIQTEENEIIKAIRPYQQGETHYDERGSITTGIQFLIVDDFNIGDYEEFIENVNPEKKLLLTRENLPKAIWWYNSIKGKTKIDW